jgi:cytochrome c biogenesis protein CcdA
VHVGSRVAWAVALLAVSVVGLVLLDARSGAAVADDADGGHPVVVRYFYGEECPYCALQAQEMDTWDERFDVEVHRYEVWHDDDNRALFQRLSAALGHDPSGVPTTFVDDRVWVGFDETIAAQLRAAIAACQVDGCRDPMAALDPGLDRPAPEGPPLPGAQVAPGDGDANPSGADGATVQLPLIGEVRTDTMGLVPATALIAFVDGFNPCSLWVLSVLLALLLRTGSRGRIAVVGGAFLLTTAAVYGLFVAGVFSALSYVGYLAGIRWAVAALALTFAAVNLKDAVAWKRGPSFTIPDRAKPRIYRGGRGLLDPDRSLPAVTGAAVLFALGVALVELPCTAGFPVVWSGILADAGVGGTGFAGLLSLYLVIYLLDELALFAAVVATLRITRFQEHHGQLLKLIGGMVMLALGLVLIVRPSLMNGLGGTLAVFAAAAAASVVVHRLTRRRQTPAVGSRLRST